MEKYSLPFMPLTACNFYLIICFWKSSLMRNLVLMSQKLFEDEENDINDEMMQLV